ncbi:hypothetical protein [Sphaerisporangium aureirubrum]|uniref:Band 7 domain-containing protein n=1 Tax=Sphaerisporangium aureirubrum TaxID=1544736 RepID=A0ABW1NCJ3_9ACTN
MFRRLKIAFLIALGAIVLISATGCSGASVNTEPDEVSIVYSAARGSATTFSKCVGASSRAGVSTSDNSWTYPAGQRTFDFSGGDGAESKPLTVVSKDNVQLTVPGFSTFALNTTCSVLKQFHERIGLKYGAFFYGTETDTADSDHPDETGWVRMLNVYFKQPLDRAMDAASQEFEWKKLFNDPATKQQWEQRVGQLAGQFITEAGGGQFFCAPNFIPAGPQTAEEMKASKAPEKPQDCGQIGITLQKPVPPQVLVDAMATEQAAKLQNAAQQQINTKVDTELQSMEKLVKLLGAQAYVLREAIKDGRVQVVITDGGAVNVTPKN